MKGVKREEGMQESSIWYNAGQAPNSREGLQSHLQSKDQTLILDFQDKPGHRN